MTDDTELRKATATLVEAAYDPVGVAAELASLRSSIRGAHALLHAIVKDKVGVGVDYVVPYKDWMAPDPNEVLMVSTDPIDNSVHIAIRVKNREERRKAK